VASAQASPNPMVHIWNYHKLYP